MAERAPARRKPVRIPAEKLAEGRRLALEHARNLLDAATHLSVVQPTAAVVLFYHSVEEIGRATIIERAMRADSSSVAGLDWHSDKWAVAQEVVPFDFLRLRHGTYDPHIFDPKIFDVGEQVDPDARERRLYVDWDPAAAVWRQPQRPEPAAFARSLAGVAALIYRWFSQGWIERDPSQVDQTPPSLDRGE